jgi:hypothetical protein
MQMVSVMDRRGAVRDRCVAEHADHTGKNRDNSRAARRACLVEEFGERRGDEGHG